MKWLSLLLITITAAGASAQTVAVAPATPAAQVIRSLVDAASSDLHNFYAPSGYAPVWTSQGRPSMQATAVITVFESAAAKGLDPADYEAGQWAARVASLRDDASIGRFDVSLTSMAMQYASDVSAGRVDPRSVGFEYDLAPKRLYLPAIAAQLVVSDEPVALLASLEPQHEDYRNLLTALARYRQMASVADDEPLPVVAKLEPGQTYEAFPRLAARLRLYGDLRSDMQVTTNVYEGALVEAVQLFQARHGLEADGVLGRATFGQLNTTVDRRVEQIEWALERWRWMPNRIEGDVILVNVPEFRLRARTARAGEVLNMRVVVGKASGHRTPLFDGEMKNVVFRPYWSVPPSIQRAEIAPKLERDATYLARNDYELVDASGRSAGTSVDAETLRRVRNGSLRVRQKPGSANALGLVKFLFPNDNNVYLHSTPQQALFDRTRRDFSHGCIRVEDPVALAAFALRNRPEWSLERIGKTMKGERDDFYVKIEQPLSVLIFYATAVAGKDGSVRFLDDIYGHDVQLARVLEPPQRGATMMLAAR